MNSICEAVNQFNATAWEGEGDTLDEIYDNLILSTEFGGEIEKPPKEEFIEKVELAFPKYLKEDIRRKRNDLLYECDWTQSRDVELANNDEWVTYRQELRDLPQTITPVIGKPIDDYFPTPPPKIEIVYHN